MAGPIVVRRFVHLEKLRTNNEVAGFKFATVGVLFAVLLAFSIVVVWGKVQRSGECRRAGSRRRRGHLPAVGGVGAEPGAGLRAALTSYLNAVVDKDWPAMERGRGSPDVTRALGDVYTALLQLRPTEGRETVLMAEILRQVDLVTQARRARLVSAAGVVPDVLWFVLMLGAGLTVGFTFFFGATNVYAQAVMAGVLSISSVRGCLIMVVIDHPFAGTVKVHPHVLSLVVEEFGGPR